MRLSMKNQDQKSGIAISLRTSGQEAYGRAWLPAFFWPAWEYFFSSDVQVKNQSSPDRLLRR